METKELTLKEKLELRIIQLGTKEFFSEKKSFVTKSISKEKTVEYVESKLEKIINGMDKVIQVFSANLALIEFLIWIKNNMFNSSGKFTFKLLKLWPLVKQVRLLINRIVNPTQLTNDITD